MKFSVTINTDNWEGIGKHLTPNEVDQKQLDMGIEVEMEHTNNREVAELIALDHLYEIPDYYTKLKKMEKEAEERSLRMNLKNIDGINELLKTAIFEDSPDVKIANQFKTNVENLNVNLSFYKEEDDYGQEYIMPEGDASFDSKVSLSLLLKAVEDILYSADEERELTEDDVNYAISIYFSTEEEDYLFREILAEDISGGIEGVPNFETPKIIVTKIEGDDLHLNVDIDFISESHLIDKKKIKEQRRMMDNI